MRLCLVLFVSAAFATASVERAFAEAPECAQACPDDGADEGCAPDCADCACCAQRTVMLFARAVDAPATTSARVLPSVEAGQPKPEPNEILHVPIALGA